MRLASSIMGMEDQYIFQTDFSLTALVLATNCIACVKDIPFNITLAAWAAAAAGGAVDIVIYNAAIAATPAAGRWRVIISTAQITRALQVSREQLDSAVRLFMYQRALLTGVFRAVIPFRTDRRCGRWRVGPIAGDYWRRGIGGRLLGWTVGRG